MTLKPCPHSFDTWLKTVCFQKPTPEAYDLAKSAWKSHASEIERLREALEDIGGDENYNGCTCKSIARAALKQKDGVCQ